MLYFLDFCLELNAKYVAYEHNVAIRIRVVLHEILAVFR